MTPPSRLWVQDLAQSYCLFFLIFHQITPKNCDDAWLPLNHRPKSTQRRYRKFQYINICYLSKRVENYFQQFLCVTYRFNGPSVLKAILQNIKFLCLWLKFLYLFSFKVCIFCNTRCQLRNEIESVGFELATRVSGDLQNSPNSLSCPCVFFWETVFCEYLSMVLIGSFFIVLSVRSLQMHKHFVIDN